MSRRKKKPGYLLHKPSGQACVRIAGKCIYLGPHNEPESLQRYEALIADWLTKTDVDRFLSDQVLSALTLGNRKAMFTRLFHSAWASLQSVIRNEQRFDPETTAETITEPIENVPPSPSGRSSSDMGKTSSPDTDTDCPSTS
jgi:hypothetical protein